MSDWVESLEGMLAQAGACLERRLSGEGAVEVPVLATVSPQGAPEARAVVLRAVDWPAGTVEVHTDLDSDKVASLRADPRAALHLWDPETRLQLRLGLRMEIVEGRAVLERWERVPEESRAAYGKSPAPGSTIEGALDYETLARPQSFAVLLGQVTDLDVVHLGGEHRRAAFERGAGGWTSRWLVP